MNCRKILLIEDTDIILGVIRDALQRQGLTVFACGDGWSGLDLARRESPDLILCDVNMEGISGHEVLRLLRENPATTTIPVILMTGDEHHNSRQSKELGATGFLVKPFDPEVLLAAIEAQFRKPPPDSQQAALQMEPQRQSPCDSAEREARRQRGAGAAVERRQTARLALRGGNVSLKEVHSCA